MALLYGILKTGIALFFVSFNIFDMFFNMMLRKCCNKKCCVLLRST